MSKRQPYPAAGKEYSPPQTGILSQIPASWVPFAELARLDRPTGIYLFYLPHLFGVLYASCTSTQRINLYDTTYKSVILLLGTVFFRAAACTWNDAMDVEYDRQVLRCRLRPLARGAVSPLSAYVFTGVLTLSALLCLYELPRNCWFVAGPSIFLLWLYPFAKRFTDFPQVILGVQVGIGFFMGRAAVVWLFWDYDYRALTAFYLANICWTIVYDTVYAQQDVEDDAKAGVRSIAVRFRDRTKGLLWTVAMAQVALLLASGYWEGFGGGYMTMCCGGVFLSQAYMLLTIDLRDPEECSWWFRRGTWFVGLSICGGLLLECLGVR
ncbi:UbiA prenyltransferase family-domain-containing protein [Poronia punctata]|nr:UbiA prenyltransferase family-domain-containing protein [Poronia punctata]